MPKLSHVPEGSLHAGRGRVGQDGVRFIEDQVRRDQGRGQVHRGPSEVCSRTRLSPSRTTSEGFMEAVRFVEARLENIKD
jgi:hypothetical protein